MSEPTAWLTPFVLGAGPAPASAPSAPALRPAAQTGPSSSAGNGGWPAWVGSAAAAAPVARQLNYVSGIPLPPDDSGRDGKRSNHPSTIPSGGGQGGGRGWGTGPLRDTLELDETRLGRDLAGGAGAVSTKVINPVPDIIGDHFEPVSYLQGPDWSAMNSRSAAAAMADTMRSASSTDPYPTTARFSDSSNRLDQIAAPPTGSGSGKR